MVRLEHVNKFFNRRKKNEIHVINDTTLQMESKGLVALLGPSGCGKTTLLNVIGGLDKVGSGNVYINGQKLTGRRAGKVDQIRNLNVGYIFQNYNLVDSMTVFDNVAIALKMVGVKDKKEIEEKVNYVLEGNINYTGAVITWLKDNLKLIVSAKETEELAKSANPADKTYLVPAFTGLGAPYWDSNATGVLSGITRTTGQAEVVRAALDCIAYQITDIVEAMSETSGIPIAELRVDGGPTRNGYLMQFQSNIADAGVLVPDSEELSAIGPAYAAGLQLGVWDESIFGKLNRVSYKPDMEVEKREQKYAGWKKAVASVITNK